MLGTIVNSIAIIIGSIVGLLIKGGLKERYRLIVFTGVGLSVMLIGLSGAIKNLINPGAEPILFILSIVIGGLLGELINIDAWLTKLGELLQAKLSKNESSIAAGFVSASLLFCIGTMAILGSFESGMQGVHTTLFAKSVLDGITSLILASTLGVGVILSAAAVFVYQGALTILAGAIEPYMTADMIREISIVGGILIFALGLNMLDIKKIKVANYIPAIFVPVIYYIPWIHSLFVR